MRTTFLSALLAAIVCTTVFAQPAAPGQAPAGIPRISCRMETSTDSLFFRGNDYLPNTVTVTIWIVNISADTAKNLTVCMVQDTRFNVASNPCSDPPYPFLLPGDSVSFTFVLNVASERASDGIDIIRSVATTTNGANATCEYPVWVEHEYYPYFRTICAKQFGQIVFNDALNEYDPNPFEIDVSVTNIRDGESDSTWIQYLGTRGVSVDTTDQSIKYLGTLAPNQRKDVSYFLRAAKRSNDTTVTLCFQVTGKGGYKRKTYIDSCCVDVFIPAAKQAVYDVKCDVAPLRVAYVNHAYSPDPFDYTADVENIGTATGKDVMAQIILPPSIELAAGETITKPLGDITTGSRVNVRWQLRPVPRFREETLKVCIRVYDLFENNGLCCDSVIIDSVRAAKFEVQCICPDSVILDPVRGMYAPDSFLVRFRVSNVGSDYADSVKAAIIIQTPDVIGAEPFTPIKNKYDYTAPPSDTLEVNSSFDFTWMLKALPRGVSGQITVKFKAEAKNAETQECECHIFIPRLEAPDMEVSCALDPPDSVRFDPSTGGYKPPQIRFRVCVRNPGGGEAKDVQATLALPPRMLLGPGETLTKFVDPKDISKDTVGCAEWVLIPVERRDYGSDAIFRVDVTASNVAGRFTCIDTVFVPALPYTVALVLPQDPVGYTGQRIEVPIFIDDPNGKDIKSFDFRIWHNVDVARNPLPVKLITLDGDGYVTRGTLMESNWTIHAWEVSDNEIRVQASTNLAPLSAPSTGRPPLMGLAFRIDYGFPTTEYLKTAWSQLLWPDDTQLLDSVLINNGSIFPRVTHGKFTVTGDCLRPLSATEKYIITVSQNRPNPFNPTTTIEYTLTADMPVRIVVFDALGRTVATLVDRVEKGGSHAVTFDATGLTSGMYFYRMDTPGFSKTMKMLLSK
jgi:hypothetical protein